MVNESVVRQRLLYADFRWWKSTGFYKGNTGSNETKHESGDKSISRKENPMQASFGITKDFHCSYLKSAELERERRRRPAEIAVVQSGLLDPADQTVGKPYIQPHPGSNI